MSQGRFQIYGFDWKVLKEYLLFVQKSTFCQGVSPQFWVKNDQIFKSEFFTPLCPQGSQRVVKLPEETF